MIKNTQNGFMALMSAVIISVLLLTITVAVSMTGIFGRFNVLDSESKERSMALAEACADAAILDLSQGAIPPGTVAVGADNCSIISVLGNTPVAGQTTIHTQGVINKSYSNLSAVVDADYSVVSWGEVSNF